MANPEHLKILKQGVDVWNKWREENPKLRPDLSGAFLNDMKFLETNFSNTDLFMASFHRSGLGRVNFINADLRFAKMPSSLILGSDFRWANLNSTDLSSTIFDGCRFEYASFVKADFSRSAMYSSSIYGSNAWDIIKIDFHQKDLIITPIGEPEITVDDLEVAQFIYLLLNNQNIRNVIETITSKAVLILGRFTPARKAVLDAIKDELRNRNYLPIVFDFENASGKSVDETVNLLARMSRFVIADITDAKSIPQELRGIVPDNPSVPIVPLTWKEQREYGMFDHFRKYPWVLPLHEYESPEELLQNILSAIILPAEQKVAELRP